MTQTPAESATGPAPPSLASPRRRTHPLTPLVASVRSLGVLVGVIVVFGTGNLRELAAQVGGLLGAVLVLGALAVLMLVALGYNYLAWTRTEYFFDESGDFRLDSGVLQRNERRVTLSRLQSVDTTRPLLGRVVGLSQVRIEVAGGGDSRVLLSYLTDAEALALRAEIIARAAGMSPDVGEAPEAVLATVPTGDLVVSLLLRSETMLLFLLTGLIVVSVTLTEGAGGLLLILVTGGLPLLSVFGQFTRFFGFTVADSPDGLRLRHGLVNVQSQTVPPGRVQAIEISEPLLWRRKGWVRVSLNVAGLQADENGQLEHVLLPVAPHDVARQIISRVMPGVDPGAMDFLPAPDRGAAPCVAAVQEPWRRPRRPRPGCPARLPHPPGRGDPACAHPVRGGHAGPLAAPPGTGVGPGGLHPGPGLHRRAAPHGRGGSPDRRGAARPGRSQPGERTRRALDDPADRARPDGPDRPTDRPTPTEPAPTAPTAPTEPTADRPDRPDRPDRAGARRRCPDLGSPGSARGGIC